MQRPAPSFRPLLSGLVLAVGLAAAAPAGAQNAAGMIVLPKLAYLGNAGCSGSKCHSGDAPTMQSGQMIGDEANIWEKSDPHAKAFKSLTNAKSKEIAGKMKLADASADARCLSCHSMSSVPAEQRKPEFKPTAGVGCEACHGAAEKYKDPHSKAGWYAEQRKTLDANGMRDTWGVTDTSHYSVRARMCVACHLQIDKDMTDAGHPALRFELGWYDTYNYNADYQPHWTSPKNSTFRAALWGAGQAASLEAADKQIAAWKAKGWATADAEGLKAIYAKGVEVAGAQLGGKTPEALEASKPGADKAAAAAKEMAKVANEAKSKEQREIVLYSVASLTMATFEARGEKVGDDNPFWKAFDEAEKAEGPAFASAVQKIADLAK